MAARRALVVVGAVVLFAGALALRLIPVDDVPVHRDWAWFLRSAGAHAVGAPPVSNHAFLYTSVPVVGFGKLLALGGLRGALWAWAALAALAAPATAWAVHRAGGRPVVALLAGLVVAASPTDITWGRGLESPYLATTLVALGAVGWTALDRRWGGALLVAAWTLAAGMHVGLVGLAAAALVGVLWEGARRREREGVAASARFVAPALLAAAPAAWILLRFDVHRLLSDVVLLSQGAAEGYAGARTGVGAFAATLGWTPVLAIPVVVVIVAGAVRGGEATAGPTLWPALAAGVAPYLAGFLATGYLSDDHSAALLPLLLAAALPAARRFGPAAAGLWAASTVWLLVPSSATPPERAAPYSLALEVADAVDAAVAPGREPHLIVARELERGLPPAMSADVLGEITRVVHDPRPPGPPTCALLVPERRSGLLGLARVPAPTLRRIHRADVFLDPGCAALRERMGLLCAVVPGGFFERSPPRRVPPRVTFAGPGSCVAPLGVDLPAFERPQRPQPSPPEDPQ